MSISQVPTETYECAQCGGPRAPETSVAGSFCSTDCHEAHRREKAAEKVLDRVVHSHKFCATCFRRLKFVYRPDHPDLPDFFRGYQHRTDNAELGEISRPARDVIEPEPSPEDGAAYDYDDPGAEDRLVDLGYFRRQGHNPEPEVVERIPDPTEDVVRTGTVCTCGNTSHEHPDETIRNQHPFEAADRLTRRLQESGNLYRLDEEGLFWRLVQGDTVREAIEASVRL